MLDLRRLRKNVSRMFAALMVASLITGCGDGDVLTKGIGNVLGGIGGVSNGQAVEQADLIAQAFVKTLEDPEVIASGDFKPVEYDGWRDMTQWNAGADSFTRMLAQNLGINDFSELTKRYKLDAKGFDGKVYVWIYSNTVFVLLSQTSRGDGIMMMPTAEEGYVPDPWDRTMAYDELYVQRSFDGKILETAGEAKRDGDFPEPDEPGELDKTVDEQKKRYQDYKIDEYDVIWTCFNTAGVQNGTDKGTFFTVEEGTTFNIRSITTYH